MNQATSQWVLIGHMYRSGACCFPGPSVVAFDLCLNVVRPKERQETLRVRRPTRLRSSERPELESPKDHSFSSR